MSVLEIVLICWILVGIINFIFFTIYSKWSREEWSLDAILIFYIIPFWGFITIIVALFNNSVVEPIKKKRQKKVEMQK